MAEVARVKGETKTLAPKFHGILLHPRMQSTAFCPQHQRCWGDVVRIFFVTLFEHSEPQMRRHLELPKAESTAHVWSGALHLSFRVHKLSFPMKSRQRQHDLDLLKMFVFFIFPKGNPLLKGSIGIFWGFLKPIQDKEHLLESNCHWPFNRHERFERCHLQLAIPARAKSCWVSSVRFLNYTMGIQSSPEDGI